MKQVFLQKGKATLIDVEVPLLDANSILVKTHYSFISSGTEFATVSASGKSVLQKTLSNFNQNVEKVFGAIKENGLSQTASFVFEKINQVMPVGYSCSGQVVAIGKGIKNFVIGDYVACAGSGFANHAEFVVVPQNLAVKIKNQKYLKQTSITTIGAIALQGLRRANISFGDKVCVIGLGLIGQLTVQMASASGCQVVGVDIKDKPLEMAKSLGADFVINPGATSILNEINYITNERGVDVTIITAASSSADLIQQAMQITRRKGRVILVGDVKIAFDRDPFYSKEIDFLISCSYGPGRYDDSYEKHGIDYPYDYVRWTENRNMEFFAQLVQSNKILIDPLISSEFNLDKIEDAYKILQSQGSLGIILNYHDDTDSINLGSINDVNVNLNFASKPFIPCNSGVRLGCVGIGGFAKTKLLPIISKMKNVSIESIVDSNTTNMLNTANSYNITIKSNDHKNITRSNLDAVLIATPHHFHSAQAIDFMKEGKAVFVEKPAAVNFDQLSELEEYLTTNKNYLFCVDFNRPFSPFMLEVKGALDQRYNPCMIFYRMNAGALPKNHWINSPENGGRIIGEGCHIFDLFLFLTNARPSSIAVQVLNVNPAENYFVQLCMDDGSCCSLLYSAIGNNELGKEYMEVFFDGKSIVMDNFYKLSGFGLPKKFNKISSAQDKGHETILHKFFETATSKNFELPIPISRILLATKISLITDTLAKNGGGTHIF